MLRRGAEGKSTRRSESSVSASLSQELPKSIPAEILAELLDLLQSYAPMWFTRRHELQAKASLMGGSKSVTASLKDLFNLLEAYAPVWYESKHREKARAVLLQVHRVRE